MGRDTRRFWLLLLSLISVAAAGQACASSGPDANAPDPAAEAGPVDAAPANDAAADASVAPTQDAAPDVATDAGVDAAPVTVELFAQVDAGAATGSSNPIHTFFRTKKIQWLVSASDLSGAGVPANAAIAAIELQASEKPGRTLDGFRIGLASTRASSDAVTAFPRPFYGAAPTAYGPADEPTTRWTVGQWTSFQLAAPFVWDGVSNVLVETSFTLAEDAVAGGGLLMRGTGRTNALVRYYSHGTTAYPFTGVDAINGGDALPAMRVVYLP